LTAQIESDVIKAVDAIHSLGVIHGDIRAANILVENNGAIWIVDFELADIFPVVGGYEGEYEGENGECEKEDWNARVIEENRELKELLIRIKSAE
jgi:serine/threonine protein kinase